MKKNYLSIMLVFAMVLSLNVGQAFAADKNEINQQKAESANELNGNIYNYDQLVTTNGYPWTAITKTIKKNYNSPDVPASVDYSEYIDGKWYSGELKRTGDVVKISDNIWQATYKGKINY